MKYNEEKLEASRGERKSNPRQDALDEEFWRRKKGLFFKNLILMHW